MLNRIRPKTRIRSSFSSKQTTIPKQAHARSVQATKAALMSTPWGLIITAITSIGAGVAKLVSHNRRFKREQDELNTTIGQQTSAATYLFDRLEKAKEGTEEYTETLKKLKSEYPDILKHYTTEEGKLNNIAAARQAVIDKIREQITEQRKLDKISEIAGDFESKRLEALRKIREKLISKYGEQEGQMRYQQVARIFPQDYGKRFGYGAGDLSVKELYSQFNEITGINLGMEFG